MRKNKFYIFGMPVLLALGAALIFGVCVNPAVSDPDDTMPPCRRKRSGPDGQGYRAGKRPDPGYYAD
jgi:hypothetical protein